MWQKKQEEMFKRDLRLSDTFLKIEFYNVHCTQAYFK